MRTNLIKTKELPKVVEPSTTDGMLDMVIAFDTTGSMSAYINAVKTHVKELVPKLFSSNPDLRIGIVAFGDYCDMKAPTLYGKAYQVLDLTNDENKIIKFINEAQDTSGGDGDEFYELVMLNNSLGELSLPFLIFKEFGLPLKKKTLNNLHIEKTTFIFAHKLNYKSITR